MVRTAMRSLDLCTMIFITIVTLLFVVPLTNVLCGNILFVNFALSPSHHIWNRALIYELIEKGHNVTMLSNDAEKSKNNFTLIHMEGAYEALYDTLNMETLADDTPLSGIKALYDIITFECEYDFNTQGFQTLLDYPNDFKFDLIIFDASVGQCYYSLIQRFKYPPAVAVTAFLLPPVVGSAFGNHLHTSYIPYYATEYTTAMNFKERILNFFYTYAEVLYARYISSPSQYKLAKRRFGDDVRPLDELQRNVSLLLCNVDPILDYPMPLPPNIIAVGGLHVKPPGPLPKDLQKILDEAKQGVILFSLGTNLRSDRLEISTRQALLDAFAKLPQLVIWKFETDNVEGLPKNVIIRKWLPQNDVLGHPNTKLFISHCGALSTQEAMYHGVPILGLPFFMDQHSNIHKMVQKKIATYLNFKDITKEIIYDAVTEMLNNPMYSNNIKLLSERYRDQPQTALERAVFWVEYVLRHGGAEHLVAPSRDMPSYQTANLDVLVLLVLGIVVIYSVIFLLISILRFTGTLRKFNTKPKVAK